MVLRSFDDRTIIIRKIGALLVRGGRVNFTKDIVECLHGDRESADGIISVLLEHCEVEMTEDLVESLSAFINE